VFVTIRNLINIIAIVGISMTGFSASIAKSKSYDLQFRMMSPQEFKSEIVNHVITVSDASPDPGKKEIFHDNGTYETITLA
jgi:hypothetical protein